MAGGALSELVGEQVGEKAPTADEIASSYLRSAVISNRIQDSECVQ